MCQKGETELLNSSLSWGLRRSETSIHVKKRGKKNTGNASEHSLFHFKFRSRKKSQIPCIEQRGSMTFRYKSLPHQSISELIQLKSSWLTSCELKAVWHALFFFFATYITVNFFLYAFPVFQRHCVSGGATAKTPAHYRVLAGYMLKAG